MLLCGRMVWVHSTTGHVRLTETAGLPDSALSFVRVFRCFRKQSAAATNHQKQKRTTVEGVWLSDTNAEHSAIARSCCTAASGVIKKSLSRQPACPKVHDCGLIPFLSISSRDAC